MHNEVLFSYKRMKLCHCRKTIEQEIMLKEMNQAHQDYLDFLMHTHIHDMKFIFSSLPVLQVLQ